MTSSEQTVVVIGLGYVGLPLAVALSRTARVFGFDIDRARIDELRAGHDRTGEIDGAALAASALTLTSTTDEVPPAQCYIVTVPTPTDEANRPDLSIVQAASRAVGAMLLSAKAAGFKPVVVFESTVYPGVTEEICVPLLEEAAGLHWKKDFFVGYSPERINPGDREHTVDKITKVVSGDTPETLDRLCELYGAMTSGGVFRAASIRTAEAAKVIENAQRDINIAFMNEIAQIFSRLGVSVWDVLAAARTKWNFLPFTPGLVGGHCIGVDPYYLAHRARDLGHEPQVILAGRSVNDAMARWIADALHDARRWQPGSVLVLGLTFKENVPDLRNSKVADLVGALRRLGHRVAVHDALSDPAQAMAEYDIELLPALPEERFDMVVLAVPHAQYLEGGEAALRRLVAAGGLLADLKGIFPGSDWTL